MDFNQIVKKLNRNIKYYANYVSRNCGMEGDDAYQEILIRMYKASFKYDPTRAKENTFFIKVIKREAFRLIKKQFEKSKDEIRNDKSIEVYSIVTNSERNYKTNTYSVESISFGKSLHKIVSDKIDFENIKNEARKKISKISYEIFEMLSEGFSLTLISKQTGMSKGAICNRIRRDIKPIVISVCQE